MTWEDDPFELRVRSRRFRGWTAMAHSESIEDTSSTLSVTLIGAYQDDTDEQIVCGDPVEAWVGADLLFTGWAETFQDGLTADGESLTIGCRSKTCDIVDCSAPVGTWKGLRLDVLVRVLVDGFGVEVAIEDATAAAKRIARFRVEPGETAFSAVDRLAKEQGLLVTDDHQGRLVLTRPGTAVSSTRIVRGNNVLSTSGTWDVSKRHSKYMVKGQTFTDADVDSAATGNADDPGVSRYRPLVIVPEKGVDKAGALQRARWEATARAGQSFGAGYEVEGWRQGDGRVWQKNERVIVTDQRKRLLNAEMLVKSIERKLDSDGRKTMLNVAPAAGFEAFVPGTPILSGSGGRWFGAVEGTTRPTTQDYEKAGVKP